jgi:hypothetical protein
VSAAAAAAAAAAAELDADGSGADDDEAEEPLAADAQTVLNRVRWLAQCTNYACVPGYEAAGSHAEFLAQSMLEISRNSSSSSSSASRRRQAGDASQAEADAASDRVVIPAKQSVLLMGCKGISGSPEVLAVANPIKPVVSKNQLKLRH